MKLGRGFAAILLLALGCGEDAEDDANATAPSENSGDEEQNVAQIQPRESATDQLIEALGGAESLDALTGLRIEGEGTRFIPNEGERPEDAPIEANTFGRVVSLDFDADALRVDTDRDITFLFPASQQYTDVVVGNLGASTQDFFGAPLGALGSDKVASIRRQETLLAPHLLLASLSDATWTTEPDVDLDGAAHHRLVTTAGPAPLTLFVNAETGELSKLETLEADFYRRDVTLEVFYADWQPAGDINFPRSLRVVRDGQTLFEQTVSTVTANPTFDAQWFDFPDGVTPAFDAELYARGELSHTWYYLLDSIGLPFNGIDVTINPIDIGGTPRVAQLTGNSHHSFVVQQANGLVLVDAPLHDDRGEALVDFLATRYPGVPVQTVVVSHFHEDHTSGIREVLGATEAELVVHESTEAFWRELVEQPSTLKPDALAEAPRDVVIRTVPEGGQLELADADNPVTIYHLATTHAADMLLTHEESTNSVFVVDIYSPGNDGQLGAADLDAALQTYAIPTDDLIIVGGHGATGDYAELEASLAPAATP